jgi:FkbM family methyltransferase
VRGLFVMNNLEVHYTWGLQSSKNTPNRGIVFEDKRGRDMRQSKITNLLNGFADRLELAAQISQGKGWGSGTVDLEVKAAAKLLENNPQLCVDVGGNKGGYTKALLREFQTKVVVFEPSKKNYQILEDTFSSSDLVKVENLALSNKSAVSTLYADWDGSGLASLTKRKLDHFGISFDFAEQVRTTRFEDYWIDTLGCPEIGLVKLDIEGHELLALDGFGDAINHIELIQFEFGGCNIDTRSYFQDFWHFFGQYSFEIYRLGPFGLQKIERYSERDEFFSTTNYYAKKRDHN